MYKVDTKNASSRGFEKPGIYTVEVVKAEAAITTKGDAQVKLIMRSDDGEICSDSFLNRQTMHWRLDALVAGFPKVGIQDGEEHDITQRDIFAKFMERFVGHRVKVKIEEEVWIKDGKEAKSMKVRKYIPVTVEEAF